MTRAEAIERKRGIYLDAEQESDMVFAMLGALHANVPEADRPMSWSDLSDEQADRARMAVRAVAALVPLTASGEVGEPVAWDDDIPVIAMVVGSVAFDDARGKCSVIDAVLAPRTALFSADQLTAARAEAAAEARKDMRTDQAKLRQIIDDLNSEIATLNAALARGDDQP